MKLLVCMLCLLLISCSKKEKAEFLTGGNGSDGYSIVMTTAPATLCLNGGNRLLFGLDKNRNGIYDTGDSLQEDVTVCNGVDGVNGDSAKVTSLSAGNSNCLTGGVSIEVNGNVSYICNGSDGSNAEQLMVQRLSYENECKTGSLPPNCRCSATQPRYRINYWLDTNKNGYLNTGEHLVAHYYTSCDGVSPQISTTTASSSECPSGGIKLTNGNDSYNICNGTNNQSVPSGVGNISPIQLCPGDAAQYPEYGIAIGNDLFAVYYGIVNGIQQAFLTKLTPNTYVTTNGTPACQFQVTDCNNGNTCINGSQVTNQSGMIIVTEQSNGTMFDNINRIKIKVKNTSNVTLNKFSITVNSPYKVNHLFGDSVSYNNGIVTRGPLIEPDREMELTVDLDRPVDVNNLPVFETKAL